MDHQKSDGGGGPKAKNNLGSEIQASSDIKKRLKKIQATEESLPPPHHFSNGPSLRRIYIMIDWLGLKHI